MGASFTPPPLPLPPGPRPPFHSGILLRPRVSGARLADSRPGFSLRKKEQADIVSSQPHLSTWRVCLSACWGGGARGTTRTPVYVKRACFRKQKLEVLLSDQVEAGLGGCALLPSRTAGEGASVAVSAGGLRSVRV